MNTNKYEIVVIGDAEDPSDCLRGLIQMVVDYTAKQLTTCLDIISEKYGHSREDLADILRNDKRFETELKVKMGLVIEGKTKSGRKIVIKKKQAPDPKEPLPSSKNSQ